MLILSDNTKELLELKHYFKRAPMVMSITSYKHGAYKENRNGYYTDQRYW